MGSIAGTAFIAHGAPTLLTEENKIQGFYKKLGELIKKLGVDTIIVSSPHYFNQKKYFEIDNRKELPCVHDFFGFPEELYEISYNTKNNTELLDKIISKASESDFPVIPGSSLGLDHGAWVPLYFMLPEKDVKIITVSTSLLSPHEHFRFGEIMKQSVLESNSKVFFLGTGSTVHNFKVMKPYAEANEFYPKGKEFNQKLINLLSEGNTEDILNISNRYPELFIGAAPEGNLNTLFTTLGFTEKDKYSSKLVFDDSIYYSISLTSFILSLENKELYEDFNNY